MDDNNKLNIPISAQVYSAKNLAIYDITVHLISNKFFWGFETQEIHAQYKHFMHSSEHLDIGPGSALFLKQRGLQRVALLDINLDVLNYARSQLEKEDVRVTTIEANLYKPLVLNKKYRSIGLSYVLHCLGGDKRAALENIKALLADDGVIFGSTILYADETYNYLGRKLIEIYNKQGIFSNMRDSERSIQELLTSVFHNVTFKKNGHVLLFNSSV